MLLCVACTEQQHGSIRFGLSAAPVTLDPRFATDAMSDRINRLLYTRLVDFDDRFRPVPSLARWEQLDPLHYRFKLGNEGRSFHNGAYLIANDVKATYESLLDPANASPHRITISIIADIEVIDDDTVDFYLHKADPLFPGRLGVGILPDELISSGHSFNRRPVGSGPLKFVDWPSEGDVRLQRISDQQDIHFITVKDSTVRVLKLLRGELDLVQGDLPQELIRWLGNKPDVIVERGRGNTFAYLGFNLNDPETGRLAVRRAIAHALDRDAIISHVLGHTARKAGAIFPPEHWSGHPTLEGYVYEPDKSRDLLEQAGFDQTNSLHISYKTSNNPLRVRLATVIQYQLKQVGIKVELNSYDWGTFYGDIKSGRFQMYSLSWVGLKIPDIFRYVFHSESIPPAGATRGRFIDATVDSLIEQAESLSDLEAQSAVYRELQEYLHEQLPYIPLWYEDNILVRRKNIKGYILASDGNYDGLINVKRQLVNTNDQRTAYSD